MFHFLKKQSLNEYHITLTISYLYTAIKIEN
jgi:hypothetical protein